MFLAVRNDCSANLPATLKHSHHSRFVLRSSSRDATFALAYVHVPSFPADECFVYFDFAAQFRSEETILQSETETLQHEPSSLLRNSQVAGDFIAGDSVLAIAEHPESRQPFCERDWRILKHCSQFHRKLLVALLPLPPLLSLQVVVILVTAGWANGNSVRPSHPGHSINANLLIAVMLYRLLECLWVCHAKNFTKLSLVSQGIYCPNKLPVVWPGSERPGEAIPL